MKKTYILSKQWNQPKGEPLQPGDKIELTDAQAKAFKDFLVDSESEKKPKKIQSLVESEKEKLIAEKKAKELEEAEKNALDKTPSGPPR